MSNPPTSPAAGVGQAVDASPAAPAPLPSSRPQPPLQEVIKGLDSRELEGQTVFDHLFGPLPASKPRRPQR